MQPKSPVPERDKDLEIRHVGWVAGCFLLLIRGYQKLLSPLLSLIFGPYAGCRFAPTCSHYAAEAIRVHGAVRGSLLGAWRLLRCTPLSKGGLDPVPPSRRGRAAPSCVRR